MRRRFLRNILIGAAASASALVGAGFSYWIYVASQPERTINSNSKIDNIKENYTFGDTSAANQYDIYFYPSTYAFYQYAKENKKPEEVYGSINITLNNHGEVVRETIDAKDCSPAVSGLVSGKKGYEYQYVYDIDHIGADANGAGNATTMLQSTYLTSWKDGKDSGKGRAFIANNFPEGDSTTFPDTNVWANSLQLSMSNPSEDATIEGDDCISTLAHEQRRAYHQYLNREDRLGYWPDRVPETNVPNGGRYLPIKLSFAGSLPPSIMSSKIPDPQADMGDTAGYHNLKFSNWVYYRGEKEDNDYMKGLAANYKPSDAFVFQDSVNVFDIGGHLDQYVAEDSPDSNGKTRYVIRLFPQFSNGKNYLATSENPEAGYRDGQRLDFLKPSPSGSGDSYITTSRYFSYDNSEQTENNLRFSKLMNVSIADDSIQNYVIRGVKVYGSPDWYGGRGKEGKSGWHNFTNDGNGIYPSVSSLKSGLYNFYIFTTTNSYSRSRPWGDDNSFTDARDALTAEMELVQSNGTDWKISSLKGKELIPVITNYSSMKDKTIHAIGHSDVSWIGYNEESAGVRAYVIMYEEVTELKAVTNISIDKNENQNVDDSLLNAENPGYKPGEITNYTSASFNSYLENNYPSFVTLTRQSKPLYKGTTTGFDGAPTFTRSGTNLVDANPHFYRVDSLDFTEVSSLFLQFRTGKDSGKEIVYNLDPLGNDANAALFRDANADDASWNGEGQITVPDDTWLYVNASKFVYGVKINNQSALRLKKDGKDTCRGYYNFILERTESNGTVIYNIYCHRRKNIFVRIFDECPVIGDDSFLNCAPEGVTYYTRSFYIGKGIDPMLESDDTFGIVNGDGADPNLMTLPLSDVFKYFCEQREKGTGAGTGKPLYKDSHSIYCLLDYVSGRVLATYDNGELHISNDMVVTKNHAFYIVSKDFYMNRINEIVGLSSD